MAIKYKIMKLINPYASLFISTLLLFSCATTSQNKNTINHKNIINQSAKIKKDIAKEIGSDLTSFLAWNLYNVDTRQKVLIYFNEPSSNYYEEPALASYINNKIKSYIDKKNQFKMISSKQEKSTCKINLHLIKNKDKFEILTNVLNVKDIIIYSTKREFDIDDILDKEYFSFRKNYDIYRDYAHLTIKEKIITGNPKKEDDEKVRYEKTDKNGETKAYEMILKRGYSNSYPSSKEVILNGKLLKKGEDAYFDGKIKPGHLHFITSFKEGFWDATIEKRLIGDKHTKEFFVNIESKENIEIIITFIHKAYWSDIQVEAYSKEKNLVDRKLTINKKKIEVFSK
jgi:hypothetical protein